MTEPERPVAPSRADEARPASPWRSYRDAVGLRWLVSVVFAVDVGARIAQGSTEVVSWPTLALAGAVLAGVLVTVAAARRPGLVRPYPSALAVLDLGLVGLSRLAGDEGALGALVVLPALVLSARHGRRGALAATGLTVALVSLPHLAHTGLQATSVADVAILPLAALCAGVAMVRVVETLREEREQTRRHRALLDAVVDSVDVGLVLIDRDGQILLDNAHDHGLMTLAHPDGYPGLAASTHHLFHEDATTPVEEEERPAVRASRNEEFDDYRLWVGPDPATRIAVSISARNVLMPDGSADGAVVATRNITPFMRALRARDTFVASAAHELRTPLTALLAHLDLLGGSGDLGEQSSSDLAAARRNAHRLSRSVGDIVHASHLDVPTAPHAPDPVDLRTAVNESLTRARAAASAGSVALAAHLPRAITLRVDCAPLAETLDEVLARTIDRAPSGTTVDVTLDMDGPRAELRLDDAAAPLGLSGQRRELDALQGPRRVVDTLGGRILLEVSPRGGNRVVIRLPGALEAPAGRH